jgi:hypothetical protein
MDQKRVIPLDTVEKLGQNWGSVLGNVDSRRAFGERLAGNELLFNKVDGAVFDDDDVYDSYVKAGGDPDALIKKTGGSGMYKPNITRAVRKDVSSYLGELDSEGTAYQNKAAGILESEGFQSAVQIQDKMIENALSDDYYNVSTEAREEGMRGIFNEGVKTELGVDLTEIIDTKIKAASDPAKRIAIAQEAQKTIAESYKEMTLEKIEKSIAGQTIIDGLSIEEQGLIKSKSTVKEVIAKRAKLLNAVRQEMATRAATAYEQREQFVKKSTAAAETVADALEKSRKYNGGLREAKKSADNLAANTKNVELLIKAITDGQTEVVPAKMETEFAKAGNESIVANIQNLGAAQILGDLTRAAQIPAASRGQKFQNLVPPSFWQDRNGYNLSPSKTKARASLLADVVHQYNQQNTAPTPEAKAAAQKEYIEAMSALTKNGVSGFDPDSDSGGKLNLAKYINDLGIEHIRPIVSSAGFSQSLTATGDRYKAIANDTDAAAYQEGKEIDPNFRTG